MDRVKAIKVLKPLVDSFVDYANITMKEEDDDVAEALEMAVEALDVPDTNVGDMISRQMAIDAIKDMYRAAEKWLRDATDDVTKARAESCMASLVEIKLRTEKLPTVQPATSCSEIPNSSGTISRQAAIDIIMGQPPEPHYPSWYAAQIEKLPAVQPVLTCKGCRYDGYYKHMRCRNCLRKERDLYEPE